MFSVIPPGKYYLGDPELLMDRDTFYALFDVIPEIGVYELDTGRMLLDYCGFIEGTCNDSMKKEYTLYSGVFGLIPFNACSDIGVKDALAIGRIVYIEEPGTFHTDGNGFFEIVTSSERIVLDTQVDDLDETREEDYDL